MTRASTLEVGVAIGDITPIDPDTPLGGLGAGVQVAQGVQWPLLATAFAFRDGEHSALVVALDLGSVLADSVRLMRRAIADAVEIDPAAVMITCTHTHSSPLTTRLAGHGVDARYVSWLIDRVAIAASEAYGSLRPARLEWASIQTANRTFSRRPVYRSGQVATHGPACVEDFLRFEGPLDEELQILVAIGDDDKPIGGLVSFACHPTLTGASSVWSADYPGVLVQDLSDELGGTFAFLQGAGANLCAFDPHVQKSPIVSIEAAASLGAHLASDAADALRAREQVSPAGGLRNRRTVVDIKQREIAQESLDIAERYLAGQSADADPRELNRALYGFEHTFYEDTPEVQEWFCRDLLGMWDWQQRVAGGPMTEELEVQVIAVGDTAIVGFPVELFCEFGLELKRSSPFRNTIITTLTNGSFGYIPTPEAFAHGGYEPRFGYGSRLVEEAGDMLVAAASTLLNELAGVPQA